MIKVYLATPYSGTPAEQEDRFESACLTAGEIIKQGHCVFSPIAHSHPIAELCEIGGSHAFWVEQNRAWLAWCDEVWVGKIKGWDDSNGVKWETEWAKANGKPVRYIQPEPI